jgi:hypothetical protein
VPPRHGRPMARHRPRPRFPQLALAPLLRQPRPGGGGGRRKRIGMRVDPGRQVEEGFGRAGKQRSRARLQAAAVVANRRRPRRRASHVSPSHLPRPDLRAFRRLSAALVDAIGHPVMWIGALIAGSTGSGTARPIRPKCAAARARGAAGHRAGRRRAGAFPALGARLAPGGLLLLAVLASSLIAQKSLETHVAAVARRWKPTGSTAAARRCR